MRFITAYSSLTIVAILILGSIVARPALAQVSEGDFVEYSFSNSGNFDEIDEGNGRFRLEVIAQYENGTLRVGFSGSMNDLEFSLRKNIESGLFSFPSLVSPPEIRQTIDGDNGSLALTVDRLPDEEFSFQASSWILNVSRINIEVRGQPKSVDVDGILKIFSISGLLQSFEGNIQSVDQDREINVLLELIDTNLDLGVSAGSSLTFLSQINALSSLGIIDPSLDGGSLIVQGASSNSNPSPYLLILALVIGIILISFVSIRARNSNKNKDEEEDKPLHWVN
ncbi:MAG: hypothetical protein O7B30_00535 [Thaumarchaeota archaeon]|nr:hypothetical protein [Nitrososphaerota archaeon]